MTAGVKISVLPTVASLMSSDMMPLVRGAPGSRSTVRAPFSMLPFSPQGVEAVARTVPGKLGDILSVKDFKCADGSAVAGDGVHNDTTGIQAALNYCITNNVWLYFPAGIYLVDNLTLPHNTSYDTQPVPWDQNMPRIIGYGVTIRKRSSADNSYLIAPARWVSNVAFIQSPVWIEGIVFDGASIAQDVFVATYWGSRIFNNTFMRGTRYGVYETVTTKNGTAIGNARALTHYVGNKFIRNASKGIYVPDDATAVITDFWFIDNEIYDNTVANADFAQCAGWKIRGNHAWNHDIAPDAGSTWSVSIGNALDATIGGNTWEGYAAQTYGLQIVGKTAPVTVDGEKFLNGLGCNTTFNGAACVLIRVKNSVFTGATSALRHGHDNSACELVSEANTLDAVAPYTFSAAGSHNGVTRSLNDRVGTDQYVYTGRQKHGDYCVKIQDGVDYPAFDATLTATANNVLRFSSALAADKSIFMPASPKRGMKYRVLRSAGATGAFNLKVQSNGGGVWFGTLGAASLFLDAEYDGANWVVTAPNATAGV